jgi:hypothetical protein
MCVCACSMQGQSKHHHGEIHYLKKYDSNFTVVYFLGIQWWQGMEKHIGMWHGNQLFTRNTADMFLCSWSAVMLVNCFAKKVDWIKLSLAVLFSTRSPCFSAQKRHTQESDELLSLWKIAIIRPDVSSRSAGRKKALEAPLIQNFSRHHTHHKWFDFGWTHG